jgi:ketosteroid isomerase-like protein
MISTGPIEDRLAIRELVESHDDAVMRMDADAWGENWAEDATWVVRGDATVGRAQIVQDWTKRMSVVTFVEFFSSAGPILVSGNLGRATWHIRERVYRECGLKRESSGRYEDQYIRIGERWYFKSREFIGLDARQWRDDQVDA